MAIKICAKYMSLHQRLKQNQILGRHFNNVIILNIQIFI